MHSRVETLTEILYDVIYSHRSKVLVKTIPGAIFAMRRILQLLTSSENGLLPLSYSKGIFLLSQPVLMALGSTEAQTLPLMPSTLQPNKFY